MSRGEKATRVETKAAGVPGPTTISLPTISTINSMVTPSVGSSTVDFPVQFRIKYADPAGWRNMPMMGFWIDSQRPSGYRLHYSAHGELYRQTDGTFKLFGERWAGGTLVCTPDGDVRHCYKNYKWDVGNFSIGTTAPLYMNHDENVQDTTVATVNKIAQVRALAMREINPQTVEVTWEVKFGKFFTGKELKIFVSGTRQDGKNIFDPEQPVWRQAGLWSVGEPTRNVDINDSFEALTLSSAYTKNATTGSLSRSTMQKYLGDGSILIDTSDMYRDLGAKKSGVLTMYFYDDLGSATKFYVGISNAPPSQWNLPTTHTIFVGVDPAIASGNYIYKARQEKLSDGSNVNNMDTFRIFNTNILRTKGWHKISFWVTEAGSWATLEGLSNGKNIIDYNLSGASEYDAKSDKAKMGSNWEMKDFRYIRAGTWNTPTKLYLDEMTLFDVPPLPADVTKMADMDYAESLAWVNHTSASHLDIYEEVGMYGNLKNWTDLHCGNYGHMDNDPTKPVYCLSWWWGHLENVVYSAFLRYRLTNLPYYRDLGNKIVNYIYTNKDDGWKWGVEGQQTHASGVGTNLGKEIGANWNLLTEENKKLLKDKLYIHLYTLINKIGDLQGFGKNLIGDSSAEDYSWGPLLGSVYGYVFYNDPKFLGFARVMARRSTSTNANTPCAVCPGGTAGVKTFYSPTDNKTATNPGIQDCPNTVDPTNSQSCFCKGDRAILPDDFNFGYLMNNHDYLPHPGYQNGVTASGVMLGIATLKGFNKYSNLQPATVADFNYNGELTQEWLRTKEFIDYSKFRFKNTNNIFRIRSKALCNGVIDDNYTTELLTPYPQDDNTFRKYGTDDRMNPPGSFALNYWIVVRSALGSNYVSQNDVLWAGKSSYYRSFPGGNVSPNYVFTGQIGMENGVAVSGLHCHWASPFCTVETDHPITTAISNPASLLRENFIDPTVPLPLPLPYPTLPPMTATFATKGASIPDSDVVNLMNGQ